MRSSLDVERDAIQGQFLVSNEWEKVGLIPAINLDELAYHIEQLPLILLSFKVVV